MMKTAQYPTLDQADLQGKRVLLRAGFDVPMEDGQVMDTRRIEAIVPTMKHVLNAGASLVIAAHQGRPKGERVEGLSQKPVVAVLEKFLGVPVQFADDVRGDAVQSAAEALKPGEVLLLENLRFDPAEKSKDATERDALGQDLAGLADIYVNDAFSNSHRDHASMTSAPKYLPSYMGLQLQKEVQYLVTALQEAEAPIVLIVSGAKMETKVPIVEQFLRKGDHILVGGCIANTFIAAQGFDVGGSKYEEQWAEKAREIMQESQTEGSAQVHVPHDVLLASEPTEEAESANMSVEQIEGDMNIFDIGQQAVQTYVECIDKAQTIIWNGPLGMHEVEQFSRSTKQVAEALARATKRGALTVVGGGDTLGFHDLYSEYSLSDYSFVSTGGAAMLDLVSGKNLAALEALQQ